jgi:hypothetical protein
MYLLSGEERKAYADPPVGASLLAMAAAQAADASV